MEIREGVLPSVNLQEKSERGAWNDEDHSCFVGVLQSGEEAHSSEVDHVGVGPTLEDRQVLVPPYDTEVEVD